MSTTRLRETETDRERERILSTPLTRKLSDSLSPSTDLSLLSPPGPPVLVKQTPSHHYNLRVLQQPGSTPGYGSIPKWSSTPLACFQSLNPPGTPVEKISSSPAVLGSGQEGKEGKGILDFQKRLDVECQEEVDSGKMLEVNEECWF